MIYSDNNNPREDSVFLRVKRAVRCGGRGPVTGPIQMVDFLRDFRCLEEEQRASGRKGVTHKQFVKLMEQYGTKLREGDAAYLCKAFDDDNDGYINPERFVRHFTGLNQRRHNAVLRAWASLPKDAKGRVRRNHLNERFSETVTHGDVWGTFSSTVPREAQANNADDDSDDPTLCFEEFLAFYAAVSVEIPVDEKFELFLLREWCADSSRAPVMNSTLREWGQGGDPLAIGKPLYVQDVLDRPLGLSTKSYNYEHMKRVHPYIPPLPPLQLPYLSTMRKDYREFSTEERALSNTLHGR
ncbi:hypothetical protein, conserved [Trypanosoma brucei gambiense DAL972]|uniref:EF-hand domain-containing protein n=1 Tax=Trypanosoma brucei gambiense (strain MHOM/CI/86/DAL972) TaxID=679716 RepID=C9ZXR8_TRYB9|nr:hypothetical protein, conserved [Trypanosoma brucei gambiense DAL972]CBH14213.1 hypothetical protein, conserved [Trypanosoma brucei gambiense DAL972]|eukprot:XP_011776483.1 hypothetical protein, conserved [Trypanosoma brucei gambiense DAL972]